MKQVDNIRIPFLFLDQSIVWAITRRIISADDIDDALLRIKHLAEKQDE